MGFRDQLRDLAHNKKALAGAAGAAGLGLFVLIRRKKGSSSTAVAGADPAVGGPGYVPPSGSFPSSSGTDIAGALGNWDTQTAAELAAYGQQLSNVQTALAGLQTSGSAVTLPDTTTYNPNYVPPTTGTTGDTFGGGGSGTPNVPVITGTGGTGTDTGNAGSGQGGVTVPSTTPQTLLPPGYGWFATGSNTYTADSIARRYGISVQTLAALNPSYHITSGSQIIGKNLPVRVRGNAAPWDLAAYRKVNHIT